MDLSDIIHIPYILFLTHNAKSFTAKGLEDTPVLFSSPEEPHYHINFFDFWSNLILAVIQEP